MSNGISTIKPPSLLTKLAERYSVDPLKLMNTLKQTCFKLSVDRGTGEVKQVTDEQMMALLIVADQYGLNPFTKEIFAFEDKHKGVVPVVSVDGWARIINSHRDLDGIEFAFSETMTTPQGGKPCPEWCEVSIYHKGRSRPTVIREYLDEVYIPPRSGFAGPWQSHTKRFLRHKTLIQGSRVAFGFGGIYDEDEAHRVIEGTSARVTEVAGIKDLQQRLEAKAEPAIAAPEAQPRAEVDVELRDAVRVPQDDHEPIDWNDTKES